MLTQQKLQKPKKLPSKLSMILNYVSPKNHQRWSTKQQWNINVSEIRSMKLFMILNVCMEIFAVTSLFLQGIINESFLHQQWKINDSEVNTSKTKKFKNVSYEIINVSNTSLKRIIKDHRKSSNETSMFRRLPQQKIFIINVCIKIIKVLATSLQRIINSE